MYTASLALSYKLFDCPDKIKPKNNPEKNSKDYHRYYNNYPAILHSIIISIFGKKNPRGLTPHDLKPTF